MSHDPIHTLRYTKGHAVPVIFQYAKVLCFSDSSVSRSLFGKGCTVHTLSRLSPSSECAFLVLGLLRLENSSVHQRAMQEKKMENHQLWKLVI